MKSVKKSWHKLSSGDKKELKQNIASGCLPPGSLMLSTVIEPIVIDQINSSKIKRAVDRLYKTAGSERDANPKQAQKGKGMVGLAAPQIGINGRVILVDTEVDRKKKSLGKLSCFINPEIIWRSRETDERQEGCYSTGPIRGLVRRPIAVKVRALRPDGKKVERVFENFTARILQHEIDHLNGICFPDRIKSPKKLHWVHIEEKDDYRENAKSWQRFCTHEQWRAIKAGNFSFD